GARVGADEGVPVEHVEGFVIRVRPDAHLGVIVKVCVWERVAVVGASCVRGGGHSDALKVGSGRNRELAENPALGELVIEHDRIAIVVGLAASAKSGPQSIACGGAR